MQRLWQARCSPRRGGGSCRRRPLIMWCVPQSCYHSILHMPHSKEVLIAACTTHGAQAGAATDFNLTYLCAQPQCV